MATMVMDMVKKSKIATVIVASIVSQSSFSGEWKFSPNLFLNETYSDNVELTENHAISSLVTQSGIALISSYKGQLLDFNFSSNSVYALYSHDHDIDNDFHTLNSNFNLKLGKQGLSLIGRAAINNRSRNGARNALADIVSNDTVRVETYSTGLAYQLDNNDFSISSNLTYNLSRSEDGIGEQNGYSGTISSENGSSSRLIFWDVNGNYQERKNNGRSARMYRGEVKLGLITSFKLNPFLRYYDEDSKGNINQNRSNESNSYGLGIRWLITPRFQLDLSYNKPIGNKLSLDGKTQKEYIDSKINWQPSTRTTLTANYSQRFFGNSYGLQFSHRNKRLTNSISYQETIQSFTRNNYLPIELGSYWCPDGDTTSLNSCFITDSSDINFDHYKLITLTDFQLIEDDVLSLNKTLSWTSELKLARTNFTLNINSTNRENLETRSEDNRDTIRFSASRKVSGRSNVTLNASYTNNLFQKDTDFEREDKYRQLSIGYDKSLNSQLKFTFDLAHVNRSSNTSQFNYNEGRVTFKITKDF